MILSCLSHIHLGWYIGVALVFAAFHCVRGYIAWQHWIERKTDRPNDEIDMKDWKTWEKRLVFYAHDAILHVVCTVFGFACIRVAVTLAAGGICQLGSGTPLYLLFLSLVGLAGITGQLAVMLYLGRMPGMR